MSLIKDYIEYIKDNPEGYWFKRRWYGYGWVPAKKEGWFLILGYSVILIALSFFLEWKLPDEKAVFVFVISTFVLTGLLIFICYKTGEKPHWQWGPPNKY